MAKRHLFLPSAPKLFIITILLIVYSGVALATQRYAVIGKLVNVRSGPGTNYDVLWQAEKYYPLQILKKSGKWCKFKDFEGDIGWIHKSLIRKIASVITIKKNCNIRSGPGLKYEIVFVAEKGVPFKVMNRKGNWICVQHSGGFQGWIYKSLVW